MRGVVKNVRFVVLENTPVALDHVCAACVKTGGTRTHLLVLLATDVTVVNLARAMKVLVVSNVRLDDSVAHLHLLPVNLANRDFSIMNTGKICVIDAQPDSIAIQN